MAWIRNIIALVGPILLVSCGSGGGGGDGQISLEIEDAYQPPGIELPQIPAKGITGETSKAFEKAVEGVDPLCVTQFRLTVSGEDMEDMVAEADAAAHQIQMVGIPPGDRNVLVEAFNGNDELLRRRLIQDVSIVAGVVTPIRTSLNTIPIILNFRDRAVVLARYFRVTGFGEPKSTLSFKVKNGKADLNLSLDISGRPLTVSPAIDTGLFEFKPGVHAEGRQDIVVEDLTNGESSIKNITVVQAEDRPGFRFVAATGANPTLTLGTGVGGLPHHHYPTVLQALNAN